MAASNFINFTKPEIDFKRVSGGWVFRAPNPWIFGKDPHYLVSDDHRVRITAVLTPRRPMLVARIVYFAFIAWGFAVLWAVGFGRANPPARDLGVMAFIVLVPLLVGIPGLAAIQRRRLRPILADASVTNERITYAEMRKADENSTPPERRAIAYDSAALA